MMQEGQQRPLIRLLELNNFMCHTRFEIAFDKLITCISGQNGSGKSAIMVALGILFGRRAQSLERGNSYKNLIKTGCTQAILRVVIRNKMKYKESIYGNEIVIEKQLKLHSSRILIGKISEKHGSVKMTESSSSELKLIIEKYKLSFDNPLNFMTQELSKRFLNSASPSQLYDFYYRGTEFKNINEELEESLMRLNEMDESLKGISNRHESLVSALAIHQENLKFLSIDFKAQLKRLDAEECLSTAGEYYNQKEKYIEELNKIKKEFEENEKQLELLKKQLEEEEREEEIKEKYKEIQGRKGSISRLQYTIKDVEGDLQEYIEEYERRKRALEHVESKEVLEKLLFHKEECLKKEKSEEESIKKLEEKEEDLGVKLQGLEGEVEERRRRLYTLKKQADYLSHNSTDPAIESLCKAFREVKAEMSKTVFEDEVIGPLCDYIELQDPRWYKPVSIILKRSISTFLVFNIRDKQKLISIFKKCKQNFSVSQLSSKNIIKSYKKPFFGPETPQTLLDVLHLKSKYVINYLVMLYSAEQILMIPDREVAYRVIRSNYTNVDSAYTPQGDRIKLVNGSLSDFRPKDDKRYWFEDKQTKLEILRKKIRAMEENDFIEYNKLKDQIEELKGEIERKHKSISSIRSSIHETEAKIDIIKKTKGTESTDHLEQRIKQLEKSILLLREKLNNTYQELEENQIILRRTTNEISEWRTQSELRKNDIKKCIAKYKLPLYTKDAMIGEMKRKIDRVTNEFASLFNDLLKYSSEPWEVNSRDIKENDDSDNIKRLRSSDYVSEIFQRLKSVASSSRDEILQAADAIMKEYIHCIRPLSNISSDRITIKEHKLRANEMLSKEKTKEIVDKLFKELTFSGYLKDKYEDLIKETIAACEKRKEIRDEIKAKKTEETVRNFASYIARSGYEGTLDFDHDAMELDMRVKVHGNDTYGQRKTLSGGERSFASVCLLVSLWESFFCPVKVLDEFDVFMDPINRKVAISLIMETLKRCSIQAILITPLSIDEFITFDCDVKIVEKANE